MIRLIGYDAFRLLGHEVMISQSYYGIKSIGYPVIRLLAYSLIKSSGFRLLGDQAIL